MDELRKKINDKIKKLYDEFYSYYDKTEMSKDDEIVKWEIFREIELL